MDEAVGRVKSIWVSDERQAIISSLLADINKESEPKLYFQGDVTFSPSLQQHLKEIVLPLILNILEAFKLPPKSFSISAINFGAASSSGLKSAISGNSLDLAVFLACISTALSLPVRQDTLYTGYISSIEGDIRPVEYLTEKCKAAQQDETISRFVYPALESDTSLQQIKPKEYQESIADIRSLRGKIELIEVKNTLEVLQKTIETEAILIASLKNDFFEYKKNQDLKNHLDELIDYLTKDNQQRFWKEIEKKLFSKEFQKSHALLEKYAEYYIQKNMYPEKFGNKLYQLMLSIPKQILRSSELIPLLSKDTHLKLLQHATNEDYEDMFLSYKAINGEIKEKKSKHFSKKISYDKDNYLLQHLLEQLDPDLIEKEIKIPLTEARARFTLESATVEINEEFIDTITAFYTHILRYTDQIPEKPDKHKLTAEALNILQKTFKGEKGYQEALAMAKQGTRGGLLYIFDQFTKYLQEEAEIKYIKKTFHENFDPLDYQAKVTLIEQFLKLMKGYLPDEITSAPAERYVEDLETIILAYLQAKKSIINLFRRF
jgi:hypothetical protein